MSNPFETDLDRGPANYVPLSPLAFLRRSASVYPHHLAVVHGERRYDYKQFEARCLRLASALQGLGVEPGDTVSVMAPNVPELLEAHYGVPMVGAVLNALNIRLDAGTIGFILEHAQTKVLLTDTEFSDVVKAALDGLEHPPVVIDICDALGSGGERLGTLEYESWLAEAENTPRPTPLTDEWQALALNYTSGT
ncbi:MAG: AMP-binding protein, partial [Gammaproteobacteria bacterium]|nr:AMP-binding protein [Gammaproteobacteria bacterium]